MITLWTLNSLDKEIIVSVEYVNDAAEFQHELKDHYN